MEWNPIALKQSARCATPCPPGPYGQVRAWASGWARVLLARGPALTRPAPHCPRRLHAHIYLYPIHLPLGLPTHPPTHRSASRSPT